MRRAARADANQPAVVKYLRSLGYAVHHTHTIGHGFADLIVSKRAHGFPWCALIELKDGSKPASAQKLTEDEQKFAEEFLGPLIVCNSAEDCAQKLLCEINHFWKAYWGAKE